MSFRRRLLIFFSLLVLVSVILVAWIISVLARRAFDHANDERTATLVAQFRHEFSRRGEDVQRRTEAASSTSEASRIAIAAAQTSPNYNAFLNDAQVVSANQRLDFLEFCDENGAIISSAQWPAKFGYKEPLANPSIPATPFLGQTETPSGPALGLFAARTLIAGDRKIYVIGGVRLDPSFLSTLDLPDGMRVMLYADLSHDNTPVSSGQLVTTDDTSVDAQKLAPLLSKVQSEKHESSAIVHWKSGFDETVNAFPLFGQNNRLEGVLLVGSSRRIYAELGSQIRSAAFLAAAAGLLLAIVLSTWLARRVTKPLEDLTLAAQDIAGGKWQTAVSVQSKDEIGQLADSFNRMTRELLDQQQRLVQAERVAAWRDLARRLAHELKNPLFPLQLTVENLLRARQNGGQQFDDTFHEGAGTLLAEIANLKSIIGRFSEFSKMPQPHFQRLQLDQLIENVTKVHHAQLQSAGVSCRCEIATGLAFAGDPELLHRGLSNLVLNAIDAMPSGGTLTFKVKRGDNSVRFEVSDTGTGLTREECSKLFTPYYTSKQNGTGLGLAIVQSIVSDHGGRIGVNSEPGMGSTFIIELPLNLEKISAQGTANA